MPDPPQPPRSEPLPTLEEHNAEAMRKQYPKRAGVRCATCSEEMRYDTSPLVGISGVVESAVLTATGMAEMTKRTVICPICGRRGTKLN